MTERSLRVEVKLTPHPNELSPQEMDRLLDGEIKKFQDWVIEKNKGAGIGASPLTAAERLSVKSYLIYASTKP